MKEKAVRYKTIDQSVTRAITTLQLMGIQSYDDVHPELQYTPCPPKYQNLASLRQDKIDKKLREGLTKFRKKADHSLIMRLLTSHDFFKPVIAALLDVTIGGILKSKYDKQKNDFDNFYTAVKNILLSSIEFTHAPPTFNEDIELLRSELEKEDNNLILTRFAIDLFTFIKEKYDTDFDLTELITTLCKIHIPELGIYNSHVTISQLETLQRYDLLKYVMRYNLLLTDQHILAQPTKEIGKKYEFNLFYRNIPEKDKDISEVPYHERLKTWEEQKAEYSTMQRAVAHYLSSLKEYQATNKNNDQGFVTLLRQNISNIEKNVEYFVNHPVTERILESSYASSYQRKQFAHIQACIQFAKEYNSEVADDLVLKAIDHLKATLRDLYNLKEV